jgi:hypothetical protein
MREKENDISAKKVTTPTVSLIEDVAEINELRQDHAVAAGHVPRVTDEFANHYIAENLNAVSSTCDVAL